MQHVYQKVIDGKGTKELTNGHIKDVRKKKEKRIALKGLTTF